MGNKIVIIGATSTIAEHCARLWVQQEQVSLILVGRNAEQLTLIAQDLNTRAPHAKIEIKITDFIDPIAIENIVNHICVDEVPALVLIAQGLLPTQIECQHNLQLCQQTLEINAISPALFAEAFAKWMDKVNVGTIAMIGSVAGDRGRQSNYIYGAAKGLIERYAQGLQHRFYGRNIKIILIKPGPTATKMTMQKQNNVHQLADPTEVAQTIVAGIKKGTKIIHTPKKWAYIMFIVRYIPDFIFGKIRI